jgi:hypothetical protein
VRRRDVTLQESAELNAGQTAHDEVGYYEVRGRLGDVLDRGLCTRRLVDLVSALPERPCQHSADSSTIVDDEYA